MRSRSWIIVLSLAVAVVGAAIYLIRIRRGFNSSDLLALLPTDNGAIVYVDVAAVRRAGILNSIAGSKPAEDLDYRQFVDQTRFDYTQDLDRLAAVFKDGQIFIAARGHFRWKSLTQYARAQGGTCHDEYCVVAGSQPGRRISFYPVRTDVIGMAVGPDDFAAYQVTRQARRPAFAPPNEPVWALIPGARLRNPGALPLGAKPFASALQTADEALFSIGPRNNDLQLRAQVKCSDSRAASALVTQLETATSTLRNWIAREHQRANPADLSGVLVGGTFHREDRLVEGYWPIPRPFLQAITTGSF